MSYIPPLMIAEFVGGPMHGQQKLLRSLPQSIEVKVQDVRTAEDLELIEQVPALLDLLTPTVVGIYEFEVSPHNDGPLWLYQWRGWDE